MLTAFTVFSPIRASLSPGVSLFRNGLHPNKVIRYLLAKPKGNILFAVMIKMKRKIVRITWRRLVSFQSKHLCRWNIVMIGNRNSEVRVGGKSLAASRGKPSLTSGLKGAYRSEMGEMTLLWELFPLCGILNSTISLDLTAFYWKCPQGLYKTVKSNSIYTISR